MKEATTTESLGGNLYNGLRVNCRVFHLVAALGCALLIGTTGCQTGSVRPPGPPPATAAPPAITLQEGNVIRVSFPGSPNLNTTQPIRRDGVIALPLIGEVKAAGTTPGELEKELMRLYATKLVSKDVAVALESSSFPVFVTGAVLRPGKIVAERPLTALEAIMEAGGFDYTKANLKTVRIIRSEKDEAKYFTVNLKLILNGQKNELFYLKPSDIVYVPERFSWF